MLGHRVSHAAVSEELVVNKTKQRDVKLSEGSHYLIVDIERESLIELVRSDPCDLLSKYFDSVVDAFYRKEGFSEALGECAIQHEVAVKLRTSFKVFLFNFECQMLWELSEE